MAYKKTAQTRGRNKRNGDKPSGREVKERWTTNSKKGKDGKAYGSPMTITFPPNKKK